MTSKLETLGPPAALLALALARILGGDPFAPSADHDAPAEHRAEPEVMSESARAVLDDLDVGDTVGELEVVRITGPTDGDIGIELRGDDCGIRAWVARRGGRHHTPPVSSSRFDLVYGPPPPGNEACPGDRSLDVLRALAERIEAGGATPPADM